MVVQSVAAALRAAAEALGAVSDSPHRDAQILVMHILNVDRAALVAHPDRLLKPEQQTRLDSLVAQGAAGVPVPYLTGFRAFYRHEFQVTPDVLIPRPETEHLVEAALCWARGQAGDGEGLCIVDVGTGSGAIALSLAAELPGAIVHALDVSPAALAVARQNVNRLGLGNVRFHEGDLLDILPADVIPDLIAANLPYIPSKELETLTVARHEPRLALDGGPDGLALIRRLLIQAADRLPARFCLLMEIGSGQGEAVRDLTRSAFPDAQVRVIVDYAGHDRVVEGVR